MLDVRDREIKLQPGYLQKKKKLILQEPDNSYILKMNKQGYNK